jgi:ornithine cyclodeaminase/alanine dehydrogenase-like protein (mu-crystallin family)
MTASDPGPIHLTYLGGPDIDRLALTDEEILDAVEGALIAQGRGQTVIEPRVHLEPDPAVDGHFNIGQCKGGILGSLRAHVETGRLSEGNLHGELGEIAAGKKPGRERDEETILFWHRGLGTTDIALGHAMLAKARTLGVEQRLRYA